eukprot:CAMPEP_0119465236 /NCGR_PEP_ID=MMETSP1344-20130328/458_1 /TAXON_ID=236787 /ORGANISM="Florenciella parvula, Strain CCMP2471" /LENGTH=185 /DNA_ID=CAMNT_0007497481 /DNA_START=1011 /DNA_END=1564 /DNA_ORIENTATION=+
MIAAMRRALLFSSFLPSSSRSATPTATRSAPSGHAYCSLSTLVNVPSPTVALALAVAVAFALARSLLSLSPLARSLVGRMGAGLSSLASSTASRVCASINGQLGFQKRAFDRATSRHAPRFSITTKPGRLLFLDVAHDVEKSFELQERYHKSRPSAEELARTSEAGELLSDDAKRAVADQELRRG